MILSTTETIPNQSIETILGLVRGNIVFARNKSRNIWNGLVNLAGGEVEDFSLNQAYAREEAILKMKQEATKLGADAIVAVRFSTTMLEGLTEILVYGTAVKLNTL